AHAVRDDGHAYVAETNLADEQQLLDEVRRRVNVDRGRRDGNQHGLRALHQVLQQQARRSSRRVQDQLARGKWDLTAAVLQREARARREVRAVDNRQVGGALREPVQARALRIVIGDGRWD